MYDICNLTDPRYRKDPEDVVRLRIKAKIDLWQFFHESAEALFSTYTDPAALAEEIISACIWTLHPHYEGAELMDECKCILMSLKIPVPEYYSSIFARTFQRIVLKKLMAQQKHSEG